MHVHCRATANDGRRNARVAVGRHGTLADSWATPGEADDPSSHGQNHSADRGARIGQRAAGAERGAALARLPRGRCSAVSGKELAGRMPAECAISFGFPAYYTQTSDEFSAGTDFRKVLRRALR